MNEKKFTDEEIKKGLEICTTHGGCVTSGCPFHSDYDGCIDDVMDAALDLINRQQAQIDRLMEECGNQSVLWQRHFDNIFESAKRTTKAEAIKEFAEKLTHTLVINNEENTEYFDFAYTLETIDAVKKEMTEGQE